MVKIGVGLMNSSIDAFINAFVHGDTLKAGLDEQLHVPLRARPVIGADLHRDGIVFGHQIVRHQLVRVVFGQLVLLSSLLLIFQRGAVIRVKVDEHTAGLEDPVPLPIGLFDMRQRPCQIPCHQHVEALRLEVRVFCVHDPERGVQPQNGGHMLGVLDHVRCQVDAEYLVALFCQQDREKSGSAAHIKDL